MAKHNKDQGKNILIDPVLGDSTICNIFTRDFSDHCYLIAVYSKSDRNIHNKHISTLARPKRLLFTFRIDIKTCSVTCVILRNHNFDGSKTFPLPKPDKL